ncbi:hypothetical protein ACLMJK_004983 [Lecanora helva]
MSMICRPKPLDGDRVWDTWEEAARFCSVGDHRYHFRIKLDEPRDGPDFSIFGEPVESSASLPNTRGNTPCDSTDDDVDINTMTIAQPNFDPAQLQNSKFANQEYQADDSLAYAAAPYGKRETVKRYITREIPVIRGSAEYFSILSKAAEVQLSGDSIERLQQDRLIAGGSHVGHGAFPFDLLPRELRDHIYRLVFNGDKTLLCTWPSLEPYPFTDDMDGDTCGNPLDFCTPQEYKHLEQTDDTEDFFLPKNIVAGIGLLTVNKKMNEEARPFLYQNRTFRFSSYHLKKLFANRALLDQLRHVELEDLRYRRYLSLVPIINKLLKGQCIQDITIGRNAGLLWLKYGVNRLTRSSNIWDAKKAIRQLSDFEDKTVALLRLNIPRVPGLSFYNFTKTRAWKSEVEDEQDAAGPCIGNEFAEDLNDKLFKLAFRRVTQVRDSGVKVASSIEE